MIKIIGDIAFDIGIPYYTKYTQVILYDIKKGAICRRMNGSRFYVKKVKHLSAAEKTTNLLSDRCRWAVSR